MVQKLAIFANFPGITFFSEIFGRFIQNPNSLKIEKRAFPPLIYTTEHRFPNERKSRKIQKCDFHSAQSSFIYIYNCILFLNGIFQIIKKQSVVSYVLWCALGMFKGDILNQIKGQINYLISVQFYKRSKVKSNIWTQV